MHTECTSEVRGPTVVLKVGPSGEYAIDTTPCVLPNSTRDEAYS